MAAGIRIFLDVCSHQVLPRVTVTRLLQSVLPTAQNVPGLRLVVCPHAHAGVH